MTDSLQSGFRIGDWEVHPQENRLKGPDRESVLEPKVMDVLVLLARSQGDVVSRRQILDFVWADVVVGDEVVSRAISLLRTELGDDQKNPRYLKTISKRGYCFIADVISLSSNQPQLDESVSDAADSATAEHPTESITRRTTRKLSFMIVTVPVLALAYFAYNFFLLQPESDEEFGDVGRSIAVLPFVNLSDDSGNEYFSDGLSEEVLNMLVKIPDLRVASRTSSFTYKGKDVDIAQIGEELNVTHVLEGSVRKAGNNVRITAQLVNVDNGYHDWSETYNRNLTDIFAIQEEIATEVAGALGVRLGVGGVNSFKGAGTRNVDAYELYLRGQQLSTLDRNQERVRLFERAIELDPNYAAAWASLGLTIGETMWINPPEDAPAIIDRSHPKLLKAVELDPDSAAANSLMALSLYARKDWIGSEEYFRKSLSLLSNRITLRHHAHMLTRAGRSTSALHLYAVLDSADSIPLPASRRRLKTELAQWRFTEAKEISSRLENKRRPASNLLIALNEQDPAAVKAAISELPQSNTSTIVLYIPVLRDIDRPETALSTVRAVYADRSVMWPSKYHDISLLAAYLGDAVFALEVMSVEARLTTIRSEALWLPVMSESRQLPEFKDLVTDINLVEYWRIYGWADHCRPVGNNNFVCS